jgi:acyl-CoA synthetase (AMP-forming)/AMP-acid ligase II
MPLRDGRTLGALTMAAGRGSHRFIADAAGRVCIAGLDTLRGTDAAAAFDGRSVLISSDRQLPAALALAALDGRARRVALCPPDLPPARLQAVLDMAEIDLIASNGTGPAAQAATDRAILPIPCTANTARRACRTEWILFTSGTTRLPKLVLHDLQSLVGAITHSAGPAPVWSTFYDIRRYGGLQILLRALLGGGSIVLSQQDEPAADFMARAAADAVTHISGTPSHWRRALMAGVPATLRPDYVRLSGEIADQAVLDRLAATFPGAGVAHAFASTEAGVAFEVRDGLAGFPADLVGASGPVEMRIENDSLRIRSARTAMRYLGGEAPIRGGDGFVDTHDMVERRGARYHFVGRRDGVINVGGMKVYPEEVEAVLGRHPAVEAARVHARPSPIMGALPAAEIVLRANADPALRDEILALCRSALPPHKVPASLRVVAGFEIAASGKMLRRVA